jgi:RNA polymerase sigma-70 factor, ECF subfamily
VATVTAEGVLKRPGTEALVRQSESDESLARLAAALGDPQAFEVLVLRHQQRIFYLLRRFTGDAAIAEELCQETFLRAWRKLATFDGRGAFGGWLTRLAHNVFLQYHRRGGNRMRTTSLDDTETNFQIDGMLATEPSADEAPDLPRLLAVVSEEEQRVLVLAYAEGLSLPEIGEILDLPIGTVKSQIHRAKQKIRRHFQMEVTP